MMDFSHIKKFTLSFFAMSALCLAMTSQAQAVPVDLQLALLVDNSGSIEPSEFFLQQKGYSDAFKSAAVHDAIFGAGAGTNASIAVQMIYWSGELQQSTVIGWTHIFDAASAIAFADLILTKPQEFKGLTAPGSAIAYAAPLFNDGFESKRLVMDVSGDGSQNDGLDTSDERDAFLSSYPGQVKVINGLPIGGTSLANWYGNHVVGGPGSFVSAVSSFDDFAPAIEAKLVKEITPVPSPEPSTMILLGTGLIGLVGYRMRKQA